MTHQKLITAFLGIPVVSFPDRRSVLVILPNGMTETSRIGHPPPLLSPDSLLYDFKMDTVVILPIAFLVSVPFPTVPIAGAVG